MCFKHDPEAQECVSRLIDLALFSFYRVCFYHNENWNTKTARDNWLSYISKPNRCHEPQSKVPMTCFRSFYEPQSKVFVLVTQSHFPNQQAADVCEAKRGHMRRLSMDHRPTLYPIWLFSRRLIIFCRRCQVILFSPAIRRFFFFFVIGTESGNNRPTVGRLPRGLGHLTVGRQTQMNGWASGENPTTIARLSGRWPFIDRS